MVAVVALRTLLIGAASVGHATAGCVSGEKRHVDELSGDSMGDISLSPDGALFYTSHEDGYITVTDALSHETNHSNTMMHPQSDGTPCLTLSPDGGVLYSSGDFQPGHSVIAWDTKTYKELFKLNASTLEVKSLTLSPDGGILYMTCRDGFVRAWDLQKRAQLYALDVGQSVQSAVPSPDNRIIYSCCSQGSVQAFSTETHEELFSFVDKSGLNSVVLSSDGAILYTGCNDGVGRAWDTKSRRQLFDMKWSSESNAQFGAAGKLSPDGSILYSYWRHLNYNSSDWKANASTVKAWDVTTGKPLFEMQDSYYVGSDCSFGGSLAVSPDGGKMWGSSGSTGVIEWCAVPTSKDTLMLV